MKPLEHAAEIIGNPPTSPISNGVVMEDQEETSYAIDSILLHFFEMGETRRSPALGSLIYTLPR